MILSLIVLPIINPLDIYYNRSPNVFNYMSSILNLMKMANVDVKLTKLLKSMLIWS